MKTVSQATEEVLQHAPFLSEVIGEGVANNAQIARRIRPQVEKILKEEVSEAAIAMALHRLSKSLRKQSYGTTFLKRMNDLRVRSNLVEFIFPNSADSFRLLSVLSKEAQAKHTSFFDFSRGMAESVLIVSSDFEAQARKALKHVRGLKVKKGLSAITMHLPQESLSVPGVYHPILKALAFEGISLVEIVSVLAEFSIIIEDRDVDRAFSVLKRITS